MELIQIDPACVVVADRLRAIDADYVAFLAESIGRRGLDTPIRVTEADGSGFHRLIAGAHRHAAAMQLGLKTIPAIPFTGDELQAEMLEIEENLVRRELSPLDQATFLAKHQALWVALYPETKKGGDLRKKAKRQDVVSVDHPLAESFSKVVSKKLGLNLRSVQRAVSRYYALTAAIRERIAGTWIADNGAALDDLVGRGTKLTEAQQQAVLDIVLDPTSGIRRIPDALIKLKLAPAPVVPQAGFQALVNAWEANKSLPARSRFIRWLLTEGRSSELVEAEVAAMKAARRAEPEPDVGAAA